MLLHRRLLSRRAGTGFVLVDMQRKATTISGESIPDVTREIRHSGAIPSVASTHIIPTKISGFARKLVGVFASFKGSIKYLVGLQNHPVYLLTNAGLHQG